MLTLEQEALRLAAKLALPGIWTVGETYVNGEPGEDGNPETVVRDLTGEAGIAVCLDFGQNNPGLREANAAYIAAANPAAILALLAQLEAAQAPDQRQTQAETPRPALSMFATMDDYKAALAAHEAIK